MKLKDFFGIVDYNGTVTFVARGTQSKKIEDFLPVFDNSETYEVLDDFEHFFSVEDGDISEVTDFLSTLDRDSFKGAILLFTEDYTKKDVRKVVSSLRIYYM